MLVVSLLELADGLAMEMSKKEESRMTQGFWYKQLGG